MQSDWRWGVDPVKSIPLLGIISRVKGQVPATLAALKGWE
jgi:hypothetical protein